MEFVTESIVNKELNYQHEEENQTLDIQDRGKKSDLYKIDIFGKNYIISLGNKKIHPKNNNLVYFVVYLMQKAERIEDIHVVTKIGVYEKFIDSESEISDLTINDFEVEKLNLLLFQKFYIQRYLFGNLHVSDEDIQVLEENKKVKNANNNNKGAEDNEEEKEQSDTEQEFDIDDLEEAKVTEEEKKEEIPETAMSIIKIGENILFEKHDSERSEIELKNLLNMEFDILSKKLIKAKRGDVPAIRNNWKSITSIVNSLEGSSIRESAQNLRKNIIGDIEFFFRVIKGEEGLSLINLFAMELAYGIKFIIVEDNKINNFEIIDGIHEEDFGKVDEKLLSISFSEDPKLFVFLNKVGEDKYEHLMVYNKNNSYVNYITLEEMTDETRELILQLFKDFRDKNTSSLLYNHKPKNTKKYNEFYGNIRSMI